MKKIERHLALLNKPLRVSVTFDPGSRRLAVWRHGLQVAEVYQKSEWRKTGAGWEAGEIFQISQQALKVDGGKCMPCVAPGKHFL